VALTDRDLARLTPAEREAFQQTALMVAVNDYTPAMGALAELILIIERLLTQDETEDPRALVAKGAGPLLDPDCRDGKCGSCVGAPCEHECHGASQ